MRMQIFRVKKPSCKILKTKNCVPFEVQYTISEQKESEEEKRGGEELRIYIISKLFYTGYYKKMVNLF